MTTTTANCPLPTARPLPKNICQHSEGGLEVRVGRGGVLYRASVPKSHPDPLARALFLRDRFYRLFGESSRPKILGPHRRGHSNTGEPGISETCHWVHERPHYCFAVNFRRRQPDGSTRDGCRRFYFGRNCTRSAAFEAAKKFRQTSALYPNGARQKEVARRSEENEVNPVPMLRPLRGFARLNRPPS